MSIFEALSRIAVWNTRSREAGSQETMHSISAAGSLSSSAGAAAFFGAIAGHALHAGPLPASAVSLLGSNVTTCR